MVQKLIEEIMIREAQKRDVEGIAPLCAQLGYACTAEEIQPRIIKLLEDKEHIIFVALNLEGQIVGWIHSYVSKLFYADKAAEIGGIVVDDYHRGYGIGRLLMGAVEEWAKRSNCIGVSLRSGSQRLEAHKFYSSIGYENVKMQYTFRKYF